MRTVAASLFALIALGAAAAEPALAPYVAEYDVRYGSMGVGSSRTELSREDAGDRWVMETRSTASGVARLIAGSTLVQRSVFERVPGGVRPLNYAFDDGTARTSRDVRLEFDWRSGEVHGVAEDEPVRLPVVPGLQDPASMQALAMLRLRGGGEPGTIAMIEKDRIKHYRHTFLGRERLATAIGELDTVRWSSARDGSDRETISWLAPALGYVVVRAEQRIDGRRRGFQTRIRSFEPAG